MNGSSIFGNKGLDRQWEQAQNEKQAYLATQGAQMQHNAPQRIHGPLESAIDSMARGLDEAFAAIDRLAERLEPVLQPELPTPMSDGNCATMDAPPPTSTSVNRLHHLRRTLEGLVNRINSVNGRLDT